MQKKKEKKKKDERRGKKGSKRQNGKGTCFAEKKDEICI